jgi:hypothetical protein
MFYGIIPEADMSCEPMLIFDKELLSRPVLLFFLRPESVSITRLLLPELRVIFPTLIMTPPSLGVSAGLLCKRSNE